MWNTSVLWCELERADQMAALHYLEKKEKCFIQHIIRMNYSSNKNLIKYLTSAGRAQTKFDLTTQHSIQWHHE